MGHVPAQEWDSEAAQGGEEGARQIRNIVNQLEEGLKQFFLKSQ